MFRRLISYAIVLLASSLGAQENPPLFDPKGLSLILGGNGTATTKGPSSSIFGANVSLVQTGTLGLPFQLGIRQTFERDRVEGEADVNVFTTQLFCDVIFLRLGRSVDFAVGADIGVLYGNSPLQWQAGPEAGIRWWIKPNAAIIGRVIYPFDLGRGRSANVIDYFIGVQVKLEKPKK
jgi:hypothetical protein